MASKYSKRSKVSVNFESNQSESGSESDLSEKNVDSNELLLNSDISDIDNSRESGNKAWADAINKVINTQPKRAKNLILLKAKKDKDIEFGKRKSDDLDNEIEMVDKEGNVVKVDNNNKNSKSQKSGGKKLKRKKHLNKNEWELMGKVKAKADDKERERYLSSIATKGVVQLFNAVREQQQTIKSKITEIGSSETKKDKVLSQFTKTQFLDKLKNKNSNKVNKNKSPESSKPTEAKKWKVLRDDFMIGAKMKDWDKESDSDSDHN